MQAPLDKNRFAFLEVFAADFRQARPERHIDMGDFPLRIAIIGLDVPIDR
jgi:hypothetical protein